MKKNIDSYFKQRLNVNQQPPADSWDYIQNNLPKKEKKRILPFWGKISGLASLLLLIIGSAYFLGKTDWNNLNHSGKNSNSIHSQKGISSPASNSNESQNISNNQTQDLNPIQDLDPNLSNQKYLNPNNSKSNQNHQTEYFILNSASENSNINQEINQLTNNNSSFNKSETNLENKKIQANNLFANGFDWFKTNIQENLAFSWDSVEKNQSFALSQPITSKKNTEKKAKKKIEFDRFYVSGFVSPMALNTFVGRSMLSDELEKYKTENSITLSYGLKGAYALSPGVKLRTGISVVGFEQITKSVPLTSNLSATSGANSFTSGTNINYESGIIISNPNASSLNGTELPKTTFGDVQQQSEYVEIPLEAEISLVKTNSIGISTTLGGSTWLLSKNRIYVHTNNYTEELGKATNLNKTSFSANAGLKFDMEIMENVKLNVEPHFKYLINPVNNIEKYNPYTVGVNAGITVSIK